MSEYKTKTVSGAVASFMDNLPGSVCKDVTCTIHSTQNLNGYDRPWGPGCGTNIFDASGSLVISSGAGAKSIGDDDLISAVSTESDSRGWGYSSSDFKFGLTAGTYIITLFVITASTNVSAAINIYDSEGTAISNFPNSQMTVIGTYYKNLVLSADTDIGLMSKIYDGQIKIMISSGSDQPTAFERYSNVCPIIGSSLIGLNRAGKNLIDINSSVRTSASAGILPTILENGGIKLTGTASGTQTVITNPINILLTKELPLIFSRTEADSTTPCLRGYDTITGASQGTMVKIPANKTTISSSSRAKDLLTDFIVSSLVKNTYYDFTIFPMLEVDNGISNSAWEPYKGSSAEPLLIPPIGKNLLSMDSYAGGRYGATVGEHWNLKKRLLKQTKNPDGSFTFKTSVSHTYFTFLAPIEPGKTYRRYFKLVKLKGAFRFSYVLLDKDFNVCSVSNANPSVSIGDEYVYSNYSAYSAEKPYAYVAFVFTNHSTANSEFKIIEPQVELGKTKTSYEPYKDVYEGTYSTSGYVTRTYDSIIFDGSEDENWSLSTWNNIYRYYIVIPDAYSVDGSRTVVESNLGKYHPSSSLPGTIFISGYNGQARLFFVPPQTITTLADFKTWLASNPLQVKYELQTPLVTSAPKTEIPTIDSEVNNLYCDTGNISVTYYTEKIDSVDTYLIKEDTLTSIADAIRTVKETSAPIEVDNFVNEIDSMTTLQLPEAEGVEF